MIAAELVQLCWRVAEIMRKNILIFCPAPRDEREIVHAQVAKKYRVIFHRDSSTFFDELLYNDAAPPLDVHAYLKRTVNELRKQKLDGIFSSGDFPGSVLSSIVARGLSVPGPDPAALLRSQHKYLSRCVQYQCVPEAVPAYALVDPRTSDSDVCPLPPPFFLKPVKFAFSLHANRVGSAGEFSVVARRSLPPRAYTRSFDDLLQHYVPGAPHADQLIAEELLIGQQVTYEGYIFEGIVYDLGITDSLFFDNRISFSFFRYPSTIPVEIQERIKDCAARCALGMGLNNTLFNIEFMYDPVCERLSIIEVNARMASQFADMYEKIDGTNSYAVAVALAAGDKPHWTRGTGPFNCAGSCVLRVFDDQFVEQVPTREDERRVYEQYPEARLQLYAQPGKRLSELVQDGKSFLYGLVHLGGCDWDDVLRKFEQCKKLLPFKFRRC